ncbi:MAG: VOC family protein [Gammaproteobacteria bacterium]|nr:VOC family protein [Gammaproteobacteria bacterium]
MTDNQANKQSVIAHLVCDNAAEALSYYCETFGGREAMRLTDKQGHLAHGCFFIGDSAVFICDDYAGCQDNQALQNAVSRITLHLNVEDVDAAFDKAVSAGCEPVMAPEDMFWGDRYAKVRDRWGHEWAMARTVREVDPASLQDTLDKMTF